MPYSKWRRPSAGSGSRTSPTERFTDRVNLAVKAAEALDDLHAAPGPRPRPGTRLLISFRRERWPCQPSEERRRSGSHYTPRALTEPIVRTTLEPILSRLRGEDSRPPRPEQILDLKVCDPAMGSGAFLVEACRQLGDALVEAWHVHDEVPYLPPDEDGGGLRPPAHRPALPLRRGPQPGSGWTLAKVSLWLVTLAKDHALTFLNHALRHGDSLVGLSRKQIKALPLGPRRAAFSRRDSRRCRCAKHASKYREIRSQIREADDDFSDLELRKLWDNAETELQQVRLIGDLVTAAFFEGTNLRQREGKKAGIC